MNTRPSARRHLRTHRPGPIAGTRVYVLDAKAAPGPAGRGGRAVHRRRRPGPRLSEPAGADRPALRGRPRSARRAPGSYRNRRPGCAGRPAATWCFAGRADDQVKLRGFPDRAGRGGGGARRTPGREPGKSWSSARTGPAVKRLVAYAVAGRRCAPGPRRAAKPRGRRAPGLHGSPQPSSCCPPLPLSGSGKGGPPGRCRPRNSTAPPASRPPRTERENACSATCSPRCSGRRGSASTTGSSSWAATRSSRSSWSPAHGRLGW